MIQMTLIVSLIITLSLSMFLLHRFYLKQFLYNYMSSVQLQEDINSATLLIENEKIIWPENKRIINISDQGKVKCKLDSWGFYSIINFETLKKNKKLQTTRLFGNNLFLQDILPSIYYSPKKKFLSVGGNTYLSGALYLPENGLQKATLEGKSYNRSKLHFGQVYQSKENLPFIHEQHISLIEQILNGNYAVYNSEEVIISQSENVNSFKNTGLTFNLEDIELQNDSKYNGKIIIKGGDRIVLDSTCVIDNCIVFANEIVLKSGFKGRGQFFARDVFKIEEGVTINSPSVLCMWNPGGFANMSIANNCRIYADIIVNGKPRKKIAVLKIGISELCGQIYCDGMLQFNGVLFGSLYANNIVFLDHYFPVENYLYNVCIDVTRLPLEYVGVSLFDPFVNQRYAETVF